MARNVIVAQSGGPSPVINASLQGVFDGCRDHGEPFGRVLAGRHGVEGILREELIDLGAQDPAEMERLRRTPSAGAVGTCRYKLADDQTEDYRRILEVCRAHDVGYFFYIGGNDSMDTAAKVAKLAEAEGTELTVVGVPKTIDNDVGDQEFEQLDHTPGYGSTARYWAYIAQILDEENRGMAPSESVSVIQAMGRSSGFIPAAARLADPQREMPLQLYLAESGHTLDSLVENVNAEVARSGRCIVVVSEGFDVGGLEEKHDAFGHIEYGSSGKTVAQVVVSYLNEGRLRARGQASGQVPGVLQRSTSIFASQVDLDEAYDVGRHAAAIAGEGRSGVMATIRRAGGPVPASGDREGGGGREGHGGLHGGGVRKGHGGRDGAAAYRAEYGEMALETVANSVRHVPKAWLSADELDVTEEFERYARPLIGERWPQVELVNGIQRFARLRPALIDRRLPEYVPEKLR